MGIILNFTRTVDTPSAERFYIRGGNSSWTTGFDDPHEFTLTALAETDEDATHMVAINQTLLESKRQGLFSNDEARLDIRPQAGPPTLDSGSEVGLRPWYNEECKPIALAKGSEVTRVLWDQPIVNFPHRLRSRQNHAQIIEACSLTVKEVFLVSIVVYKPAEMPPVDTDNAWRELVRKEYGWGYEYTVVADKTHPSNKPVLVKDSVKVHLLEEKAPLTKMLKAEGLPATENPEREATPNTWEPDD